MNVLFIGVAFLCGRSGEHSSGGAVIGVVLNRAGTVVLLIVSVHDLDSVRSFAVHGVVLRHVTIAIPQHIGCEEVIPVPLIGVVWFWFRCRRGIVLSVASHLMRV